MGYWKMNLDASYVRKSNDTCLGVVVRDHKGTVALSIDRIIKASDGAEEAETEAIKIGLLELSGLYHGNLVIESDCLSIINRLKAKAVEKSCLHHIVQDIKDWATNFQLVTWSATR
jgi:hypothetical protein